MPAILVIRGTLHAAPNSTGNSVAGFRLSASVTRMVPVTDGDPTTIPILCAGGGIADAEGAFEFTLGGDGEPGDSIALVVATPDGTQVFAEEFTLQEVAQPLTLEVEGLPQILIAPTETRGNRILLLGRVLDEGGRGVPANLPVVLWGVEEANDPPRPLVIAKTTNGGYFSGDWVSTHLHSAFGRIDGAGDTPIRLDDERLPRRVLLVMPLPQTEPRPGGPPRAPDPAALTDNPAAFSQDLGRGCVQLSTPNRAIEEFIYTQVVRTSEPEVKGLTLGGGGRKKLPPGLIAPLVEASVMAEAVRTGAVARRDPNALANLSLDVDTARRLADGDHPPTLEDIHRAAWLSDVSGVRDLIAAAVTDTTVRQQLNADHPIDWDETPTIYQAITIARGHLLEFREVWRADGYSLGDLLHSLPLAPGQRRQVAILDWERRNTSVREEALEYEEELEAMVGRDRDVTEIVGSRLAEESQGASRNTTWGVAGGVGGGFIAGAWGVFGGVAGSASGSESKSWLDSSRQFSADTLQSLRDRVVQRSSSVRDERSTTVQSVAEGETLRAETETIANYNHCHAMTIEYFEVLRHFIITHELANVRDVLFVPMAMTQFYQAKVLRWQTPLSTYLKDRELLPGFDAMRRVVDNWEGWDYPVARYSEEAPQVLEGELRISFILPRPRDSDLGFFLPENWKPLQPYLPMAAMELWGKLASAIAAYNAAEIARRDFEFRRLVAPGLARRIMDRFRFSYVTTDGSEREVPLDATLVSSYAEGVPLYVTLRASGGVPPTPREKIAQFAIRLDGAELPPDAQIIVHNGKMRYRTEHKSWLLFHDDRILNDLSNTDAVFIPTPTSWEETRNPRQEDKDLAVRLVAHLNASLEFYHQAIWMWLDEERRFMLLDGILVPGLGGRSVASVVENRLIGIAGNSMIFPLAPGLKLDPRVSSESEGDLIDLYGVDAAPPVRVSVPTRGVYAEAVLGECNACEEIDDSRYWRWTTAGMLAPPTIEPVSTASRATPDEALTPTPLPTPLVSIQNAPALPNPVGLGEIFQLLAKSDTFTDITGLEGTQKNARAAFDAAMSAASGIGTQAAQLASQNITAASGERMLDRIMSAQGDGLLSEDMANKLSEKVFGSMLGQPNANTQTKLDSPLKDPAILKAIDSVNESENGGSVKVGTSEETINAKFGAFSSGSGTQPTQPSGPVRTVKPGRIDYEDRFVKVNFVTENIVGGAEGSRHWARKVHEDRNEAVQGKPLLTPDKVRDLLNPPVPGPRYEVLSRLVIEYGVNQQGNLPGTDRLPIAVLVHGEGHSWGVPEVRNYLGFPFLMGELVDNNIIAVSVDVNAANASEDRVEMRAELIFAAFETLRDEDANPDSPLYKRLGFDNVGMMGHETGGDAVVRATILNRQRNKFKVKALALVAPTDWTGTFQPGGDDSRMDLDAATCGFLLVIVPGLDGNVPGGFQEPLSISGDVISGETRRVIGTGFRHYDRCTADKALAYFPLCINSFFNEQLSESEESISDDDRARMLPKGDHESILTEYVGGLFEFRLTGMTNKGGVFNGAAPLILNEAQLLWAWGSPYTLLDDFESAQANAATRSINESTIVKMADYSPYAVDLEVHVPHQTSVLAIHPNQVGIVPFAVELALSADQDWHNHQFVTLNVAIPVDVSSEATIAQWQVPWLTVSLEDDQGIAKGVDIRTVMKPDAGKPVFHFVDQNSFMPPSSTPGNCTLIRMVTCAIPMAKFDGINKNRIRKLQILAPVSVPQPIFVDSIGVVR